MSSREFSEWLIFFKIENEEKEKAYEKARKDAEQKSKMNRR